MPLRDRFLVSRLLFARLLAAIFFVAFASLAGQIRGLLGARGISPAADFLPAVWNQLGTSALWQVPTLFWFGESDAALVAVCGAGCAVAVLLALGRAPGACALVLWALYLSLCTVGSPFLNFQWDALLLETALLAVFFLPWKWRPDWAVESPVQRIARWLLGWLLARLMLASAIVKLSSGDETWRSLTALRFHFETQPLPLPTAWLLHQLPPGVLRVMELAMFAIELVAPLLLVAPRRWRHAGAGALILLQVAILTSGNYAFFNWLTIALCLLFIDDARWPARWHFMPPPIAGEADAPPGSSAPPSWWEKLGRELTGDPRFSPWPLRLFAPFAALILLVTTMAFTDCFRLSWRWPDPFFSIRAAVAPFASANAYGLFAVMTTQRREITLEGSNDGVNWQAYRFRWKPDNVAIAPTLVAPHQPRLDWQMWFAALGDYRQNPWLLGCITRLLQGSPEVIDLFEWNPFPHAPPRTIRAVIREYRFTRWGETGWWQRGDPQLYCPPMSLRRE